MTKQPIENTRTIAIDDFDDADLRYCKMLSIPDSSVGTEECYGSFYEPTKKFTIKCIQTVGHWK